jgi:hypothetical protein
MPAGNNSNKAKPKSKKRIIFAAEVGNYEKHPFFVKKAHEAKAFLKTVGLPKTREKKVI